MATSHATGPPCSRVWASAHSHRRPRRRILKGFRRWPMEGVTQLQLFLWVETRLKKRWSPRQGERTISLQRTELQSLKAGSADSVFQLRWLCLHSVSANVLFWRALFNPITVLFQTVWQCKHLQWVVKFEYVYIKKAQSDMCLKKCRKMHIEYLFFVQSQ